MSLHWRNVEGREVDLEVPLAQRVLDLGGRDIVHLSMRVEQLTNVKTLWLVNNRLVEIPVGVLHMTQLTYLDLSLNCLKTVDSELAKLRNLTILYVRRV